MRSRGVLFFCTILMFSFTGKSVADEVYLKNGDHITGQVITMEKGELIFETSYAGEIHIDWAEVSELKTDAPITVVLSDDTSLQGIPKPSDEGEMKLETEITIAPVSFNIAEVKAINPKKEQAVKLSVRVNFGLKIEGGNTDKKDYHIDGQIVSRTKKNRFTAGLELDREETDDVRTEDSWLAYTKYDHFLTEKWYLNTNASFEKDEFKEISSRTVLGAGPGYQLWHTDLKNLSAELGYAYVNETYEEGTPDEEYSAIRWAMNFDYFIYKKIFQFFHWDEAFLNPDDTENIWLRSRTGLRFPIYKGLTWTVQYNLDWDKSPLPGLDEADTTLLFTLGYQFEG